MSEAIRQPAIFVGHGAPTLALDAVKGADLRRWGEGLKSARSILVVSAHWQARVPTTGTITRAPLVYDFGGFPAPLYQLTYPAPGAPELARRVGELLSPGLAVESRPDRGWDHGVWVPLLHLFPAADTPVLQLALPRSLDAAGLFALGQRLAPLRDEGILVMASGSITHNLGAVSWDDRSPPPEWAAAFDSWTADVLARRDWTALLDFRRAPGFEMSHPSPEHFLPLLVAAGAASAHEEPVRFPIEGFELGSLSRRSVQIG